MSVNWYPVVNEAICNNCMICVDFCSHGVYDKEMKDPSVVKPENCIEGCRGCQNKCPLGAINYIGDDGGSGGGCSCGSSGCC